MSESSELDKHFWDTLAGSQTSQTTPPTELTDYIHNAEDVSPKINAFIDIADDVSQHGIAIDFPALSVDMDYEQHGPDSFGSSSGLFTDSTVPPSSMCDGRDSLSAGAALQSLQGFPVADVHQEPFLVQQRALQHETHPIARSQGSMASGPRTMTHPSEWPRLGEFDQRPRHSANRTSAPPAPVMRSKEAGTTTPSSASADFKGAVTQPKMRINCIPPTPRRSDVVPQQHICDICFETFGRIGVLERHKETLHNVSQKFYRCRDCNYSHRRRDKVLLHCQKEHKQHQGQERCSQLPE